MQIHELWQKYPRKFKAMSKKIPDNNSNNLLQQTTSSKLQQLVLRMVCHLFKLDPRQVNHLAELANCCSMRHLVRTPSNLEDEKRNTVHMRLLYVEVSWLYIIFILKLLDQSLNVLISLKLSNPYSSPHPHHLKRVHRLSDKSQAIQLLELPHDKTNNVAVRPAKTQISLGICPVWSESSLSAWRNLGSLAIHWVHSEDSDQTGRMPRLICLRWAHTHFVGFVMSWLTCLFGTIYCYGTCTVKLLKIRTPK